MITTMTRLTTLALIGSVIMISAFADPDLIFYNEENEIIPGINTVFSRHARTASPVEDFPIIFPGSNVGIPPTDTQDTPELPSDIDELDGTSLNRLNNVTNISEFADFFNLALPEPPLRTESSALLISTRVGGLIDEAVDFPLANCKPELVTVPLDLPTEAGTIFFPTCIRLEQCGGCCFGSGLTCRPTSTKVVKVKVLKVNSAESSGRGDNRRRRQNPSSYHTVAAIKHTSCKCGCKVREEDCNSDIHTYFEGECSCVCKNKDEKKRCESQDSTKYWDNNACNCYCRKPLECGSGEFFSQNSCSCERLAARSGVLVSGLEGTEA